MDGFVLFLNLLSSERSCARRAHIVESCECCNPYGEVCLFVFDLGIDFPVPQCTRNKHAVSSLSMFLSCPGL